MRDKELPLVGFTVLSQLSVGLCLAAAWLIGTTAPNGDKQALIVLLGSSLAALALAMIISLLHLGHPLGSIRTLTHLHRSWLSREIAAFGAFGLIMTINLALTITMARSSFTGIIIAAGSGITALYASARVYSAPSFPALDNAIPFTYFIISALILGPSFAGIVPPIAGHPWLKTWLLAALAGGGLIHLLMPFIWLRGGFSARRTGADHLRAPLFWLRLVLGYVLPIGVMVLVTGIPTWLPATLLITEMAGRILLFSHVAHSAESIGFET